MAIINQIPPLNLNPVLIALQKIEYRFSTNKNDVISQFDSEIEDIDNQIIEVDTNIKEVESGKIISSEQVAEVGGNTDGCSVSDKNKRVDNIKNALDNRKSELEIQKNNIEEEREENRRFYETILNTLGDIVNTLFQLLKNLVEIIATAISSLEGVISTLSALPLGAGLAGAISLNFILQLLQTKIYEPVSDTVDQQEVYDREAPSL